LPGSQGAKILAYDIETAPNIGYSWRTREVDILKVIEEWYILCFAYTWIGEGDEEPQVVSLPDFKKEYKADPTNDFRVVKKLHELFGAADIVVGHNSNSYDNRRANARFLVHQLGPPEPFRQLDTCLVARRYFDFNSNKLNDLAEVLGIGSKAETGGFNLWIRTMAGDKDAWATMTSYCAQDVALLRDIYYRLRPWIDGHPNVNMITRNLDNCPKCGSPNMTRQGFKFNKTTTVQQWKCGDCGGWSSSRISEKTSKPSLVN
jgi:hypothetical protein